jgi:ADP-ribose pyrophosphatase YjhB (NUDIX family)
LQVREGRLRVLLWRRAREPFRGAWALPGGTLGPDETLEESIRRQLAEKVDVRDVAHLEQVETRSDPHRNPERRELATG